jgi:prepilin-type N-terminal cleavage/methylation domain-containing protein
MCSKKVGSGSMFNGKAAGFTLIEILVALSIFSVAVLGLAIGSVSVTRANQTSYLRTAAINLAQARLEEIKAMSAAGFAATFPTASCPCAGTDVATSAGKNFNRSWTVTIGAPVTGVNRIDVAVSWTDYANQSVAVSSSVVGQ